ncbi:MAG: hypothetical protein ACLUOI_20595 [Eisenbergiella sp.]
MGFSKCSVLSGGCQRGKTPRQKFLAKGFKQSGSSDKPLRAAASRQNGALRNITIFSDVPPTHTHSSGGEGGRTGVRQKREAPCGGWVYPGVVVGGGKEKREREKREGKREKGKDDRPEKGNPAWFLEDKGINNKIGLIGEEKNSWVEK